MSMTSEALPVGTWHELTDLDDPSQVSFFIESGTTDVVMIAFSDSEPTDQTSADVCNTGGMNHFSNLFQRRVWVKLFHGSANVIYSQRGAIEIDEANCATVTTDYAAINRVDTAIVIPGYDTTPADDLLSVGLIHTIPAGIDEAATIDSAILVLNFAGGRDRTFQIAGMKALTSITSGLTGFENLAGPLVTNVTTSNLTFTVGNVPSVKLDVTDIVQELVNQSGWNADSPIQLRILDSVMAPEDSQDHRINVLIGGRLTSLFVRSS